MAKRGRKKLLSSDIAPLKDIPCHTCGEALPTENVVAHRYFDRAVLPPERHVYNLYTYAKNIDGVVWPVSIRICNDCLTAINNGELNLENENE